MAGGYRLSDPARAAFAVLHAHGERIRAAIATESGLSLPSITKGIHELIEHGLVRDVRHEPRPNSRPAIVYGVAPTAGWVLGVDIGATHVTLEARGLEGTLHDRQTHQIHENEGSSAAARLAARHATSLASSMTSGPLRAVGLALNQLVPADIHTAIIEAPDCLFPTATSYSGSPSPAHRAVAAFDQANGLPPAVMLIENNVACAAVAEYRRGSLRGARHAAYLQVGLRIGLGFFLDGALRRGNGGTGEVATIPSTWWGGDPPLIELEDQLGSPGLMRAAADTWPDAASLPSTPGELITLAEHGHEPAASVVARHAVALGRLALTAAAIVDPTVLALGGGLAQHPHLAHLIAREFHRRNPRTKIVRSTRTAATVEGAALLAEDRALTHLLGDRHVPLLPEPALWTAPPPGKTTGKINGAP